MRFPTRFSSIGLGLVMSAVAALAARGQSNARSFDAIWDAYLHGDATVAVREFARWPEGRVEADATPIDGNQELWVQAARAMLHTEAALLNERFLAGRYGEFAGINFPFEAHTRLASDVISRLVSKDDASPDIRAFCRDWLTFAASFERRLFTFSQPFDDIARKHLSADPLTALLLGSDAEYYVRPIVDQAHMSNEPPDDGQRVTTPHGVFSVQYRREAEHILKKLTESTDAPVEARLRFGRIQYLLGSPRDAQALLEGAFAQGQKEGNRWVSYMAEAFLGELLAFKSATRDDAIGVYRQAVERDPSAQPGYIGLSQLLLMQGREKDAWAVMDDMFAAGTLWNPWSYYGFDQFHDSLALLSRLRSAVASHIGVAPVALSIDQYLQPVPEIVRGRARANQPTAPEPAVAATPVPQGTFHTLVDGVRVDVLVMDGDTPVTGLTAADFVVRDRGVVQEIDSAATVRHLAMALAVDVSHPSSVPIRTQLIPAARHVLDAFSPGDRGSLLTFADEVKLQARDEVTPIRLRSLLSNLTERRHAYTALWDAAYAATSLVARDEGRPYVVLFSEGNFYGGAGDNVSWLSLADAVDRLKGTGAVIDGVWTRRGPVPIETGYLDQSDIVYGRGTADDLLKATGGKVFSSDDPDLGVKLQSRVDQLRHGYVLTYTPNQKARAQGWHPITVSLKKGPGQVQARPGYYSR